MWKRSDHKLFSFVGLIGSTMIGTGLKLYRESDTTNCLPGIRIRKSEIVALDIGRADFPHRAFQWDQAPRTRTTGTGRG